MDLSNKNCKKGAHKNEKRTKNHAKGAEKSGKENHIYITTAFERLTKTGQ